LKRRLSFSVGSGFASALIFQIVIDAWAIFDSPVGRWVEGLKNWLDKIEPLTRAPSVEVGSYYSATQSDNFLEILGRIYSGFFTLNGFALSASVFLLSGFCSGKVFSSLRLAGWAFWLNLTLTPVLFSAYVWLEGDYSQSVASSFGLMIVGSLVLTSIPIVFAVIRLGLTLITKQYQPSPVEGESQRGLQPTNL